jgi:transcriptional regulator with XRE-family HTH domain
MPFSTRLKKIRRESNKSQAEMAEILFMEQSTYSKYETGKIIPNTDMLQRISEKFSVDIAWLLSDDGNDVHFENGSVNNGNGLVNAENFYSIPKEIIDSVLQQQQLLQALSQDILARLQRLEKN